jgi:Tat protein translocase TatB subunit
MGCTPTLSFLPSVGSGEWLVILAVVLIVVGPRRLPEVARKMGRTLEGLRRAADDFRRQIERMDEPPAVHPSLPPSTHPLDALPLPPRTPADPPPGEPPQEPGA